MSGSADPTPFDRIGGLDGVRALVDRFYDLMDTLPEAAPIRGLHAKSLRSSREKLTLFLAGWLGGPPLYVQKYGHPRLRARHRPFPIGDAEAEQWMLCMNQALAGVEDAALRTHLSASFERTAAHMRNQGGMQVVGPPLTRGAKG